MAPTTERTAGVGADPLAAGLAGPALLRGGSLRVVAYAAAITMSVAVLPFVTRHLHSADYGRYVVVTSLMLIVTALTEGGIANLGVREFSTAAAGERREFMRSLIGIRIVLSLLGGGLAIAFTVIAGYPPVVVEGTAIASLGLVLANLQITLTVPLTAALRLPWLAALDVATPLVTTVALVALVLASAPLLAFFGAAVVAYAISLALTVALVHGELTLRPAFHPARWVELLRDSAVFAAATALGTVYFQVVLVAMSVITSAHETGVFSLAFRVLSVVNGIPVVLVASAFPILLRAARDDRERLRGALQRLLEASLLLGGWLSLVVVAAAPFAIRVLGGSGFAGATTVLRILGTGVAATFVAAVLAMTLLSVKAYRELIVVSLAMIVLAIVLCAVLIPPHGARGAAVVTLTLEVVLAGLYATILWVRDPALRPSLARAGRVVAALAIAFTAALVPPVSPVLAAVIGTGVLAIAAPLLRAVPVELLDLLPGER